MTTTPIEGFPASQEEYSEWSEKYTPPTAVGEPWTQTINASELDAGSDLVMPDTTTAPDGAAAVLNSKGVSDMAKAEAARLKEIQDDLVEAEEEKRPWVDKLTGKKTSKADTLAAQQTKYDISGKLDQLSSITNLTLPLQTQMADLEARQQREIDRNDERLASSVAKDREANAIDLRYAKLQAPLAAKLNAYAAQAQAVQGNLSIANQFISQAVNAAVYDQEFEYNRTKDIMDANQDYIDGLEDDEKEILNNIQNLKLDEFNNAKVEKTAIGQLIVKYNQYGAGITFDDTLEEAQIKAGSLSTDEAELLSVAEAKSLGVPYGTTQAQAIAMGITPAGTTGVLTDTNLNKLARAGVPSDIAEKIQIALNEGATLEEVRTALAEVYGRDQGFNYLDRFMQTYEKADDDIASLIEAITNSSK